MRDFIIRGIAFLIAVGLWIWNAAVFIAFLGDFGVGTGYAWGMAFLTSATLAFSLSPNNKVQGWVIALFGFGLWLADIYSTVLIFAPNVLASGQITFLPIWAKWVLIIVTSGGISLVPFQIMVVTGTDMLDTIHSTVSTLNADANRPGNKGGNQKGGPQKGGGNQNQNQKGGGGGGND